MAQLSSRELATVLAALRHWQSELEDPLFGSSATHFDEVTPLSIDEIDDLCDWLNR